MVLKNKVKKNDRFFKALAKLSNIRDPVVLVCLKDLVMEHQNLHLKIIALESDLDLVLRYLKCSGLFSYAGLSIEDILKKIKRCHCRTYKKSPWKW